MDKGTDEQRSRQIAERVKAASPQQPGRAGCARATEWNCLIFLLLFLGMCALSLLPPRGLPDKAKEAEVKQNLHAIQLALERYAVDHDGVFPPFLYGGDAIANIGTVNFCNPGGRSGPDYWDKPLHLPFDVFNNDTPGWDYHDIAWEMLFHPDNKPPAAFGDPLAYEGYMPSYPSNPFQSYKSARQFSLKVVQKTTLKLTPYSGYGGRNGYKMWNLGCFGELPQLMMTDDDKPSEPRLDFPGCFYYHPRWSDEVTNFGHNLAAQPANPGSWLPGDVDPALAPPLDDSAEATDAAPRGYALVAYGSPKTAGQDLDVSVAGRDMAHFFRTGYMINENERNPWVRAGDYGPPRPTPRDFDVRPSGDGVWDFIILELESSPPFTREEQPDES